jgi:PAS domain S-box-containing protein
MKTLKPNLEPQHLAQIILDASLNGIFACTAIRNEQGKIIDFEIILINKAFTKILGLSEREVIGRRYLEVFPSAKTSGLFDLNCKIIETGGNMSKEVYYKDMRLDSWYNVSLSKLGDDGLVVTFIDITEQKKSFLQLERQKGLLDNILSHSANGISVTEVIRNDKNEVMDGRTIIANDAAVQFSGIPRELYLSKTAIELEPNILQSEYYQLCLKTLETGEPQFTRYFLEFSKRWLEITISKLDDDHIITIFTDVTKTQEAELKQNQLIEELKRSNENLEDFTRAASHDLKEPIRKVQFFTSRLKDKMKDYESGEEKNLLEKIENAAERMRLLVDDLLEYSHVSLKPKETEVIDLNEKINLILSDLEILIKEKNAKVIVKKLPTVRGYRRRLQQLFQNLISNSLKYSKPDVTPVIEISCKEVKGSESGIEVAIQDRDRIFYQVDIKDNGIGFQTQDAERIFGMFQRLHGNKEYSGTGVGLAIAKKVVENHNGYIKAEGRPKEGAVFHVLLPK